MTIDDIIIGLEIFRNAGHGDIDAMHEQIFAGPGLPCYEKWNLTNDNIRSLKKSGWFWDTEYDRWAAFV